MSDIVALRANLPARKQPARLGRPGQERRQRSDAELLPGVDPEEFSALVAGIYDTTLEPGLWPAALDACRAFVGGYSAAIISKHISGTGQIYHHDGHIDPGFAQLYFERYVKMDPANVGHLFAEIDEPMSTTDILDLEEFRRSRFHLEWGLPQGLVDFVAAPLEKSGGWAALLGILRHARDGMVDDRARHRMRLITSHVRRAVLIGRVVEAGRSEAESLRQAFDGLAAGMFLVDARGRVVHANTAGAAMLDGQPLQTRDGRLVPHERAAAPALANVLAAAAGGDAAIGVSGISLAIEGRDGERYVAHVLPLSSDSRRRAADSAAAVALLCVQRAALEAPAAPEVIAKAFELTPSELRVLLAVVEVGGVAETAERLGIGEATVKTHLNRVFAKTESRRQADLVKLVAGFAHPLAR